MPEGKPTKEEVKALFDDIDEDKNGSLTVDDLKKIAEKLGEEPKQGELDEIIKMCDESGDGKVSFDEFWETVVKYHSD